MFIDHEDYLRAERMFTQSLPPIIPADDLFASWFLAYEEHIPQHIKDMVARYTQMDDDLDGGFHPNNPEFDEACRQAYIADEEPVMHADVIGYFDGLYRHNLKQMALHLEGYNLPLPYEIQVLLPPTDYYS